MTTSLIQPSFAGGEVSPSLYGRVDLEKYQTSLRRCRNFIVRQYGGVENRPGTRYVSPAKYPDRKCRLIPFQFNTEQTYVLEVGDHYFRVFMDGAQVVYSSGASAGQPVDVATPWAAGDIDLLKYTQSADVMTVCHPNYPPMEIQRYAHDDWRTAAVVTVSGPFANVNIDEAITVYASATSGTVTLTASASIFKSWHVGSLFYMEQKNVDTVGRWVTGEQVSLDNICRYQENYYRCVDVGERSHTGPVAPSHTTGDSWDGWAVAGSDAYGVKWRYLHSGRGICRITAVSGDGLTATADVVIRKDGEIELPGQVVGESSATYKWAHYAWNSDAGYPGTVVYFQQRLMFAGSRSQPQTVWTSRSGDYKDFGTSNPTVDDDAITYTYAGRQLNQIRHLIDVGSLVALTSGGEYKVNGNQQGALTPSAFQFSSQGQNGASHVQPIAISNVALFIQQKGGAVRDLAYSFDVDGFQGSDLTILANHFFTGFQITDWAFSITPMSIVWCVRNDGALLGLTYLRDQQVAAWHLHPGTGRYESLCSIAEDTEDALYCVVERTINGQQRRYIERMQSRLYTDMDDAFFVDCGLTYDGRNRDASKTMMLSGGSGSWPYDEEITLSVSGASYFTSGDVGSEIHMPYFEDGENKVLKLLIRSVVSGNQATVTSNRDVPEQFRGVTVSNWSMARGTFSGLDHLEGQAVSILSDANVEPQKVVTGGSITLEKAGAVVHAGLPIAAVIETLDVNLNGNETLLDKKKLFTKASLLVNESRGVFAATPGCEFYEYAQRDDEFYDEPVDPKTGTIELQLDANWGKNGRLIVKQDDPLPMTILAVIPRVTVGGV
ncbi:hypothetical protein [Serratia liquefaciens]|uniref:Ubiquitin-activating enzyme E1 FCCH domain-containing protein n=1 Tax=Serratia liquefaciens TaxID=614 RepID=A0A515CRI2_SERLI|nr:hypothetical protein [Serratia liquefaciens]QDL30767.1 hypothetical protein EGO53_02715 [Serratia liquefaciens]